MDACIETMMQIQQYEAFLSLLRAQSSDPETLPWIPS